MPGKITVSIILCTCNRSATLKDTLEALSKLRLSPEWTTELVVVDNGSTNDTASIIKSFEWGATEVRYLFEPRKGACYARNSGMASARGDIILFTDDDIIPSESWAMELMRPLLDGTCDAATGQIALAPNLIRPWLTSAHRWWLASSDDARPRKGIRELISANMGLRRSVLDRVPAFDTELGPGALGFGEDSLFGWQLSEAGFRIEYARSACVTHHLDKSRLRRAEWLSAARKRGRSEAYVEYHWEHTDIGYPRLRQLYYFIKLQLRRVVQPPPPLESEGCPPWEMSYVLHIEKCKQFRIERRRPRNYVRQGLTKRVVPDTMAAQSATSGLPSNADEPFAESTRL